MCSTRKKRILLLSQSGQLGGLELRLHGEAKLLAQFGYIPEVAINPFSGIEDLVEALDKEGIEFNYFNPPPFFEQWQWRRFNRLRANLFFTQFYTKSRFDLVHVAFAWTSTGVERLWLAHKSKIPTVISIHNAFPYNKFSPWHECILFECFKSVRGIYAVSDTALKCFLESYKKFILPNTLLKVIYNPIDNVRFKPSVENRKLAREHYGLHPKDFVIGVVGRLSEQKRPLMLLDVFVRLKRLIPNIKLVFIGQGELEEKCKEQSFDLGISDSVHFLGFCQNIERILPMLDLHVLLSRREGFGIATAEAMACGVPVVATDVPGSKDILENSSAGVLVSPDNIADITSEISQLINNKEVRSFMSKIGVEEVEQRFSRSSISRKLECFYNKVLPS